jgi:hypothetical protein
MGVRSNRHTPTVYSRESDSVPLVQKGVWVPELVWTGVETL